MIPDFVLLGIQYDIHINFISKSPFNPLALSHSQNQHNERKIKQLERTLAKLKSSA
jgi:hypothetical protein